MSYGKIAVACLLTAALSSPALAAGDPAKGKAVFARCAICHTVEKDAGNGVGPDLFGVVGRKAASVEGFNYSGALKKSGIVWNDETLEKWISGPAKMVPGNKMAFPGISSHAQVEDVVAYLKTLK